MTTLSIRTELLGSPTPNPPPATSLIRLVLATGADKAEAAECGISTRLSIIKTARQSCDQIDTTIAEIDSLLADAQETAWPKFNKYSRDIKSLEDLLLDQKGFFRAVDFKPKTEPVTASLNEADNWETHRGDLKSQLDGLHQFLNYLKGGSPRTTPPAGDQQRDDAAIIHLLNGLLTQETSGFTGHASDAITQLKNALSTIDPVTHKDGIIPAIKGAWIVYAAAWESKSGSDAKQRSFMSSKVVWDAVKSFSGILKDGNASAFQAAFNSLKDVLTVRLTIPVFHVLTYLLLQSTGLNSSFILHILVTAGAATQNYLNIVKAAKSVRRPFMDLNNLLVEYCFALVDLHHKADPGMIVANNTAVSNALKYALAAAEAAKGSLPGTATLWKGEVPNKDAVDAAFNNAFDNLKPLFQIYDPSKLTSWDEAKNKASEGDINRFEQLKATPFGNPSTNVVPTGKVVTIHIKDATGSNSRAISIHDSTKIEKLIWREGHQFIGAKEGGRPLALGKTIMELGLSGKTIELITAPGVSLSSPGNRVSPTPRPQVQQQPIAPTPRMSSSEIAPTDLSQSSSGNRLPQAPRPQSQQQPIAPTPRMSSSEIAPTDLSQSSSRNRPSQPPRSQSQQQPMAAQTHRPQVQQQPTAPIPRLSSSEIAPSDLSQSSSGNRPSQPPRPQSQQQPMAAQTPRPQLQQQPMAPSPRQSISEVAPPPEPSTAPSASLFSRGFSMMKSSSRSQLPPQAAPPTARSRNGEMTHAKKPVDSGSDSDSDS